MTISFKFYNAQSLEFSNFTSRNLSHRYSSHVLKNAGVKVCIAKLCVKERKRKKKENRRERGGKKGRKREREDFLAVLLKEKNKKVLGS